MAHRRMGGGRSYNNYSHHVNPWQDGAAPGGNQGFNSSGISQLVDPTQIALAITNLLRPQQSQSVPSLLSLPPIAPVRNSGRQYGYNNGNNVNSYRSNYSMGNKMNVRNSRDMDFNKRQNISNRKPQQRKPNATVNRTATKNTVAKPKVNTNSETSKTKKDSETSSKLTAVKSDADTNDDCKPSEDQSEEQEGGKRDWKEEKGNSDFNESNNEGADSELSKKADGKTDSGVTVKEEAENSENDGVEEDAKSNETKEDNPDDRYAGIPTSMLRCFICVKRMWDVESFEKHIRGKAHQEMLDSYEESCKIKANMMRESMRLAEEKKWIEMNRLKRLGKHVSMNMESHCNMCDLNFIGKLNAHRKSQGHQKLKYFIHPRCTECQKEFQTRIEFEHHRLSPSHMKVRLENWNKKKEGSEDAIPIENEEIDLGPDMPEDEDEESEESVNKNIIFDISEDMNLADLEHRLPHYSKKVQFGASFIEPITGHRCKLCNLFLLSENSMKAHLSSAKHYNAFVDYLIKEKNKTKLTEKRPIASEQNDDNEGNWKRRKVASEETDVPMDDNVEENTTQEDVGNEIYDPIKADNDHSESENEVTEVQSSNEESNSNKNVKSEENLPKTPVKQEDVAETVNDAATDETKKDATSTSPRTRARSLRNPAQRGKARGGKAQ